MILTKTGLFHLADGVCADSMKRGVIGHVLYVPTRRASSIGFTQPGDPAVPSNGSGARNILVAVVNVGPALQVVRGYDAISFNHCVLNRDLAARCGGDFSLDDPVVLGSYILQRTQWERHLEC
jgi:hypothetical protein